MEITKKDEHFEIAETKTFSSKSRVTLEQLERKKQVYERALADIEEKIREVKKL